MRGELVEGSAAHLLEPLRAGLRAAAVLDGKILAVYALGKIADGGMVAPLADILVLQDSLEPSCCFVCGAQRNAGGGGECTPVGGR